MPNRNRIPHVFIDSGRIALDAQALAWATMLIAASAGAASCGGQVEQAAGDSGAQQGPVITGPGVCAVYYDAGVPASSTVTDSGFAPGVCPIQIDAGKPISDAGADAMADASDAATHYIPGVC